VTDHSKLSPGFSAPEAKILVVDDLPTDIKITTEMIHPCGATVYVSLSGAQAVEMVQNERYDLVFMDQIMPEMDGIETVSRIRSLADDDGYFHNLPIVVLTASTLDGLKESFSSQGIDGFITKPVNQEKLFEIIKKLLPADKIIRP